MFYLGPNLFAPFVLKPTTARPADGVTARTMTEQIRATTMGSAIPYVIGTGRVDGLYFIGGIVTETISTYHEELELAPSVFDRVSITTPVYTTVPTGAPRATYSAPDINIDMNAYQTVTVEEKTTRTSAHVGYILAYDAYERGYDLIQLQVGGEIVFDTENGIGAGLQFRFYGGRQDRVDPLLTELIGDEAGAYQNFVMVFLEGYESSSAPSVSAVISNAATDQPEDRELEWTGAPPPGPFGGDSAGVMAAYDPVDSVLYQLLSQTELPGVSAIWLVVFDLNTRFESYRVALADSSAYATQSQWIMAIRGSGHVLVRLAKFGNPKLTRVYNATTGAVVAEYEESPEALNWKMGMPFGDQYVFIGHDLAPSTDTTAHAVVDLALSSLDVTIDATLVAGNVARGRTTGSSVSFFVLGASPDHFVTETVFDGTAWTNTVVYNAPSPNALTGIQYDEQSGYLVAIEEESGTFHVRCINPDTGEVAETFSLGAVSYFIVTGLFSTGTERYWPRPGFVFMQKGSIDADGSVWLFSIEEQALALYAEKDSVDNLSFTTGIFDQNRLVWYESIYDDHWVEHALPNQLPGLIDLEDIVTDTMALSGFEASDLSFSGFSGLSSYGYVIKSDTNIQAAVRSLADVYDFSFCDTGSGFVFKKPGRDDVVTIDTTFAAEDLVERPDGAVQSRDEASLRTPAHIEFEYVSKDARYQVRPASFTMPTGVLPSIMIERFSTPVVMTDASAQQLVTEKFFEAQQDRRDHNCTAAPEHLILLPGDIVSIPSGALNFIAKVNSVALELRNMSAEIGAIDFQTEVAAEITAVTNNVGVLTQFSLATQYVHLDIPLYNYADDLGGGLVQYGMLASKGAENWAGGILYSGPAPTELAAKFDQAPHGGVIGSCVDVLVAPPSDFAGDFVNSVTINVTSGDSDLLVERPESEVMEGANMCAIGQEGRWELLGFTTVEDNGDGSFTLSGFAHRGYRGTEVYADDHAAGDLFVLLNLEWLRRVAHPVTDLDDTFYYKAAGSRQNPAGLTVLPHTIAGAAETPYAPVNLAAAIAGSDIALSWDYRSRLDAWEMFDVAPSSGEATLAFEVDVMDGATVVQTITAATNSATYLAADIAADFGSMPASLSFRVYQMSAVVGRGHRAEETVTL
jgi:hypothetical protein